MLVDRRRSALPPEFLARVGAAWAIICALLLVINWGAIATMRFPDPDDTMRLIQVRDLVAGQGWFDLTQYRANAPEGGVAMHWSRIVDAPLALIILILTPLLGANQSEMVALVATPLLTLGVAMLLAARIAWHLLGDEATTFTCLIMAVCVPVIFQLGPMRIDHHGWQLVCALVAMNGLMARSPVVGGRVIGASLATWLMISLEGFPLSTAIFAVLALRWLRDRNEKALLVNAIQSLAITCFTLFALTRGFVDLASYCDALSPVHLTMFGWGAIVLTGLARLEPLPLVIRLGGFALAGGGALAMLLYAAPMCATGGGFSALDPIVQQHWYVNVKEGMPVWRQSPDVALQYAITPMIGLFAAIRLAQQSYDWLGRFWRDYALILGASLIVALLVARAGAVACLIAAPPLAWQLDRWLRNIRKMDRPLPRVAGLLAVSCALLPTLPLSVSGIVLPARAQISSATTGQLKISNCRIEDSADILNALPKGEIFSPLDIAPKLLLVSHHSVPATGHHRGDKAMASVIETYLGPVEVARDNLNRRGSRYVALCPNLSEPGNYMHAAPDGFMAALVEDRAPEWLEPVEAAEDTSLRIWKIKS